MRELIEIQSGRMRPRHGRFHRALRDLCADAGIPYRLTPVTTLSRIMMNLRARRTGIRAMHVDGEGGLAILHQALNRGDCPYISEFDVPLGVHGYSIAAHREVALRARGLMEKETLRAILVFSEWAKRSFDLHFGPRVGAKCRVIYPLASESARCGIFGQRKYDFTFISTQFRIKSGPEAVRAFCAARAAAGRDARMCVVTDLDRARGLLGDLAAYEGIEWREANQSEQAIADLLADTDCLVHPSLNDSFGVVVLEALAAGCAVIATDIASFPEMVVDGSNGLMFTPPTSAVVGNTYITEYGTVAYHEAYLNTLSLHAVEHALRVRMETLLRDRDVLHGMMQASHGLFQERFALPVWQANMKLVLAQALPELAPGGARA